MWGRNGMRGAAMLGARLSVVLRGALLAACFSLAAPSVASAAEFTLASEQEAAAAISAPDEYLEAVTSTDISIWLRQPNSVADRDALARHLAANVRPWSSDERARLGAMLDRLGPRLQQLAPWLPAHVQIAAFNGEASSNADFTRGTTIFLAELKPTDAGLDERFFHELYHVLSRANAARRDELYAIVGFERCTPMTLDRALTTRILVNPDAPIIEYASRIVINGQTLWATPLMLANLPRYTERSGLFDHIELQFIALHRDAAGRCEADPNARVSQRELGDAVIAQAGGNTAYVIHPEELMADNFAQFMVGRADVRTPQIHDRIATILGVPR